MAKLPEKVQDGRTVRQRFVLSPSGRPFSWNADEARVLPRQSRFPVAPCPAAPECGAWLYVIGISNSRQSNPATRRSLDARNRPPRATERSFDSHREAL